MANMLTWLFQLLFLPCTLAIANVRKFLHMDRAWRCLSVRDLIKYLPLNGEIHCYIIRCVFKNCCYASLLNNTLTMWHFLIKAHYLGKFSVTYDAENVGLSQ